MEVKIIRDFDIFLYSGDNGRGLFYIDKKIPGETRKRITEYMDSNPSIKFSSEDVKKTFQLSFPVKTTITTLGIIIENRKA